MASFDLELHAVTKMGLEYCDLLERTSGIGENHGPSREDFDPEVFIRLEALPGLLDAAFARLDRDHPTAWRAYLDDSANRLRVLAASGDGAARIAHAVLDRWEAWIAGEDVADAPAWFGTGIEVMTQHLRTIDRLLSTATLD